LIADEAVKYAIKAGADEAEAYLIRVKSLGVHFTATDKNIIVTNETGLGIQVAKGKRLGFVSTSMLEKGEIEKAISKALKIADVSPEDPHWVSFNKKSGNTSVNGLYDKAIAELTSIDLVERVDEGLKSVIELDPRVTPAAGSLDASSCTITYTNSYMDEMRRSSTVIGGNIYTKAEEDGRQSTGSEDDESRSLDDFSFEKVSLDSADQALRFLNAKPHAGGAMTVILRNDVFGSLLSVMMRSPINALSVQRGTSPLAGKIEEQVGSENITLIDDGSMRGGLVSRPFDDEGHPTQKTIVIEEGILQTYLYDHYTGLRDNHESTGNAFRNGYRSRAVPSASNLVLKPGKNTRDEIIESTQNGLFVESVIGEWLSNPVSSELNATVTHGHMIQNGELVQTVTGVVIAGNFLHLLRNSVEEIGSDVRQIGGTYTPSIKISKLTVAGSQ
jgi:PmbA protein